MKVRRIDFSPDEWLVGTTQLDNAARGLYITACALIYSSGGAITLDRLRYACKGDHGLSFNRQLRVLVDLGKLTYTDGMISNKRCENELRNAEERSENARRNAGERWKNTQRNDDEMSENNGLSEQTAYQSRNANHQPSTITTIKPPKSPAKRGTSSRRRTNGKDSDPWHLTGMTDAQLRARFNATAPLDPEHEAIRQILNPGSNWAGI